LRRLSEIGRLWSTLEREAKNHKLNERVVWALADAAIGLQVKNPTYRKQAEITNQVAKKDLKRPAELGLLVPKGERRGRVYIAGDNLKNAYKESLLPRERFDPFVELELLQKPIQQELPGLAATNTPSH
jgi:hypothetical protein